MNYFRITGYYPKEDISLIIDSNGAFEKLWQFSAFLVSKGIKIIEVQPQEKFIEGTLPLIEKPSNKVLLRSYAKGQPDIIHNRIKVGEKQYFLI